MKVWMIHEAISIQRPWATIGIFDGVHTGHRFILDRLKKEAKRHGGESVVVTLWPHPRLILNVDLERFRLLHSLEEKIRELNRAGIGHLVIIPFDRKVAALKACEFVKEYLVSRIGIEVLMLGYDNKFGSDRNGDPAGLAFCADRHAFRIEKLPEFTSEHGRVSSTTIREAILRGELETARILLGYPYYLTGRIVEGNQVGRELGFPTANVDPADPYKLIPMNGVYAVRAELQGRIYGGMMNIGFRPTIDSASAVKTIETHLFDLSGDFYGQQIVLHFVQRVRDEMRFSGKDALKAQLMSDQAKIRKLLQEV
jgi:riboflavin kinase/FMN adenylyltransferase